MIQGRRVVVVLPAYNAAETLEETVRNIPADVADEIVLVDDSSADTTVQRALELGLTHVIRHPANRGYGGNQKTCYRVALELGADIAVLLHPDYQYSPRLLGALAGMIASGHYDAALGSRILGGRALEGGMPRYKYIANRALTLLQNLLLGMKLSEFHSGYRAFSRRLLEELPLEENSDDFVFDNQMLVQAHHFGFAIGELSCPTRYAPESSSISLGRSVRYGLGVISTTVRALLAKWGLSRPAFLRADGRRLAVLPVAGRAEVVRRPDARERPRQGDPVDTR